ncbi:ABC transporter substrate-binding protein [Prosthecomicrobium sp. N25]|uniref:ABC transporter substrate-binding protein n=1 Tax=Prosthecomicrobium sp. N25 TaxID=3129254 RepID=UPI0030782D4F
MPAVPFTRRSVLAGGLAALAAPRPLRATEARSVRIGAVLPIGGGAIPAGRINLRQVGEVARTGLVLAEEDASLNAGLLGWSAVVRTANAPTAETVERAARRLVEREGVSVLVGGYTRAEAEVLSRVAEETGALYLNVGATSDALRQAACRAGTFHVEASAAMYLDAIFGWYVRAGFRRWHLVRDEDPENVARHDRALAALKSRHWAVEVTGTGVLAQDDSRRGPAVLAEIGRARPQVVLLLTDWRSQLDFLSRFQAAELGAAVVGFPEPATQTRDYYLAANRAAPVAGSGRRAALWEATLDAYGARELNARFAARWGRPMDPPAWTAYQAVKIAVEAAIATGSTEGRDLAAHLAGDATVFDVSKGIGVSFRPWDHQLRQSLYLVKINEQASDSLALEALAARASLEGELPAIYMPGTDPVQRLDQIGDVAASARCGPKGG